MLTRQAPPVLLMPTLTKGKLQLTGDLAVRLQVRR
jgi:hypothetical protein